jgi:ABC-2 type transport system ATP-binding protein
VAKTIIEVKNLTRKFGNGRSTFTAVNTVSFKADEGEIVGLLGPNGAGKTTIVQMILDLLRPTEGEITIFGLNHLQDHTKIMSQLNFSSTYVKMPGKLTVAENLYIFALLFDIKDAYKRVDEVLSLLGCLDLSKKRYSVLSSGQRTRVGLAKSLLNNPRLLLLDEPTASLDPDVADRLRELIKEVSRKQKTTVLFTSHNMAEVEELCDRVVFINHGRVVAQGSPLEVTQKILKEKNTEPDLGQVFLKIVREFGP